MDCQQCGRPGAAYSQAASKLLCEACYAHQPTAQYQESTGPVVRLRPPGRPKPDDYERWVHRVWDRLEQRTGHQAHYMARNQLAGYCPSCMVGTLTLTFRRDPIGMVVRSEARGVGYCSEGCPEAEITLALR